VVVVNRCGEDGPKRKIQQDGARSRISFIIIISPQKNTIKTATSVSRDPRGNWTTLNSAYGGGFFWRLWKRNPFSVGASAMSLTSAVFASDLRHHHHKPSILLQILSLVYCAAHSTEVLSLV